MTVGARIARQFSQRGWVCEVCTFKNRKLEYLSCEVCGTIRKDAEEATQDALGNNELDDSFANDHGAFLKANQERRSREEQRSIIMKRMEEIVEIQRELCQEFEQNRVRLDSLVRLSKAQKDIENLEMMLKDLTVEEATINEAITESTVQDLRVSTTAQILKVSKTAQNFRVSTTAKNLSVATARPALNRKGSLINTIRSRRPTLRRTSLDHVGKKASLFPEGVNPWEKDEFGVEDILGVQSQLWDKLGKKPVKRHTTHTSRFYQG